MLDNIMEVYNKVFANSCNVLEYEIEPNKRVVSVGSVEFLQGVRSTIRLMSYLDQSKNMSCGGVFEFDSVSGVVGVLTGLALSNRDRGRTSALHVSYQFHGDNIEILMDSSSTRSALCWDNSSLQFAVLNGPGSSVADKIKSMNSLVCIHTSEVLDPLVQMCSKAFDKDLAKVTIVSNNTESLDSSSSFSK